MVKLKTLYFKYTTDHDKRISPEQFSLLLKDLNVILPDNDVRELCDIMGDITYEKIKLLFKTK